MTALETETHTDETPERAFLVREFNAEATSGDGRTIDMRIVPYGEVATVDDGQGAYSEEFAPGAFDEQLVAGHRLKVWLNFQHERGVSAVVGKGVALREEPDGLHGTFRALDHTDGDKALALVKDGMLDSVSLEFLPKSSAKTAGGVVRRLRAHLDAVALCRQGAYAGAKVLAVREVPEQILDEALLPVDLDPGVVERLLRQGFDVPDRYKKAHPAGTPDDSGTPDDGTRHPAPSSEEES